MCLSDSRWASGGDPLDADDRGVLAPCSRLSSGCVRYRPRRELLSDFLHLEHHRVEVEHVPRMSSTHFGTSDPGWP